jgi:hypothetical protein
MKKPSAIIIAGLFAVVAVAAACDTPAEKVEDAKEKVQDAKDNLKSVKTDSLNSAVKTENAAEWQSFKNESDLKIDANKIRIEEIKAKIKKAGPKSTAAYEGRIDSLQQRNEALKARMYSYENGKTDWESFKSEFNHDMDGLAAALKNFTVSNKR